MNFSFGAVTAKPRNRAAPPRDTDTFAAVRRALTNQLPFSIVRAMVSLYLRKTEPEDSHGAS